MNVKVSVVFPVYNVEEYLGECLDSILNQTLKDIEVICVDDGSTDSSLEILREYEKKDSRVTVLEQENLGAGAARNKGLAIAKGKYLSFLDADDFFVPGMLEAAYDRCEKTKAEICVYQVMRYHTVSQKTWLDKGSFRREFIPKKKVFSYQDMPDYILNSFQNWAWNKLIRRDLVIENNIKFQEIFRTNDFLFVALCMTLAKRITALEQPLVYYRVGMKNNCQATNGKYPLEFLKAFRAVKEELIKRNIFYKIERSYVNKVLAGCIYNLESIKDPIAKRTLYYELKDHAFEELGITGKEIDYFYDYTKKDYRIYQQISSREFEDFFFDDLTDYERTIILGEKYLKGEKKDMAKVSIIVPTFNVEEYLVECMESIVRQTLKDIEIICINDGSTDGSLEILQRYASIDDRIIIVDKPNEGYGVGMNIGLDRASGEYIGIVEPDDFVPLNMYEDLYLIAKDKDLDFIKADFYRFGTKRDKSRELTYNRLSGRIENYNVVFNPSMQPEALNYVMNTWSGIYKREFIEKYHIRHHETPGASFQDNGFWIQTFVYATRAMIIDKPYYMNRRDNPNSSVKNLEKVYCMNEEYKYIKEMLSEDKELWDRFKYWYSYKKYNNYIFTLNRIAMQFKKGYVKAIRKEFMEAIELGEVDKSIFPQKKLEDLELLIADPRTFFELKCVKSNSDKQLKEIKSSKSYKLARGISYFPRKVRETGVDRVPRRIKEEGLSYIPRKTKEKLSNLYKKR